MRTAVFLLLSFGTLAVAEPAKLPLPGYNSIPLAEVARTCKGALVATLVSIDWQSPGAPGATDVTAQWKVVSTLRGSYPASSELGFTVQTFPEEHRQRMPTVGHTYILISQDITATWIAYVFEHTPDKLREIQQLLSAKSK